MFGKEKKPKKPKSKARKIIDWVITGIFATLIVGVGVIQIINRSSDNQFVFGPKYQRVLTDSMSPVYKINDIIVIEKTNPDTLYKMVVEQEKEVDISFHWIVNGKTRSMTHRIESITKLDSPHIDPETGDTVNYIFIAHGINKQSEFCKIAGQYGDCTTQTQEFYENAIIGRVTRKSAVMSFMTSVWGLLILLLVPCMYLIIASVIDIVKAVDDKEEVPTEGLNNGEVVGEASDKPKDPLEGLSEKEKEKLKKQMLDEMLGKKK